MTQQTGQISFEQYAAKLLEIYKQRNILYLCNFLFEEEEITDEYPDHTLKLRQIIDNKLEESDGFTLDDYFLAYQDVFRPVEYSPFARPPRIKFLEILANGEELP